MTPWEKLAPEGPRRQSRYPTPSLTRVRKRTSQTGSDSIRLASRVGPIPRQTVPKGLGTKDTSIYTQKDCYNPPVPDYVDPKVGGTQSGPRRPGVTTLVPLEWSTQVLVGTGTMRLRKHPHKNRLGKKRVLFTLNIFNSEPES